MCEPAHPGGPSEEDLRDELDRLPGMIVIDDTAAGAMWNGVRDAAERWAVAPTDVQKGITRSLVVEAVIHDQRVADLVPPPQLATFFERLCGEDFHYCGTDGDRGCIRTDGRSLVAVTGAVIAGVEVPRLDARHGPHHTSLVRADALLQLSDVLLQPLHAPRHARLFLGHVRPQPHDLMS